MWVWVLSVDVLSVLKGHIKFVSTDDANNNNNFAINEQWVLILILINNHIKNITYTFVVFAFVALIGEVIYQ